MQLPRPPVKDVRGHFFGFREHTRSVASGNGKCSCRRLRTRREVLNAKMSDMFLHLRKKIVKAPPSLKKRRGSSPARRIGHEQVQVRSCYCTDLPHSSALLRAYTPHRTAMRRERTGKLATPGINSRIFTSQTPGYTSGCRRLNWTLLHETRPKCAVPVRERQKGEALLRSRCVTRGNPHRLHGGGTAALRRPPPQ